VGSHILFVSKTLYQLGSLSDWEALNVTLLRWSLDAGLIGGYRSISQEREWQLA
jgi:hypothetical protein